ncbi:MAG: nicotinamide mononucleotide transporter [Acidobacteria bacterium]|nr:nicotinamide mononucleotide transporter [Acidobacteriota bacterium]
MVLHALKAVAAIPAAEWIGFVTGLACVLLGIYENVWNWPLGIASNFALFLLFRRNGIYAASWLQLAYIAIALYGWWHWLRGNTGRGVKLPIRKAGAGDRAVLACTVALATITIHAVLYRYTTSTVPWWDSLPAALSLGAQYLLSRKLLEVWPVWITADALYISLCLSKGLYLTAALYVLFAGMCFAGYRRWRRQVRVLPATV